MGLFGTSCPPPFYNSSREIDVVRRLKSALVEACGENPEWPRALAVFAAEEAKIMQVHMEEHAAEVYRTFPGLTYFPPEMPRREVISRIRSSSLLTGERYRFKRIRRLMREAVRDLPQGPRSAERRRRITDFQERALLKAYSNQYGFTGEEDFEELRRLSRQAIADTHFYIERMLKFLPPIHRKQLEFAACVRAASDFPALINLAGYTNGKTTLAKSSKGIISRRIGFEARTVAVLAQLEFEYLMGAYKPERVDAIRKELIQVFENQVFDPELSVRLVVVAELDPAKEYRVKRGADGQPMLHVYDETDERAHQTATDTRVVLPLDARVVNVNGKQANVYFDTRRKEMVFAKQLRNRIRNPESVTDHSGFILVFFSDGIEAEMAADKLREFVVTSPGQVTAQMSNAARAGAVDPGNPHSAVDRRAEKYVCRWGGINHEVQLVDITTYIESLVCHTRLAHDLYKFLVTLDTAFPFVWPKALYGKDWMDAEFRDLLWRYQILRLWTGHPPSPQVPSSSA